MITINLDDTFDATSVSEDLTHFTFNSELIDGSNIELHVVISEHPDAYLPDVFNLAFGALDGDGEIDDNRTN